MLNDAVLIQIMGHGLMTATGLWVTTSISVVGHCAALKKNLPGPSDESEPHRARAP